MTSSNDLVEVADRQYEPSVETEFYFQWHITERCNCRCRHCYHTSYDSRGELTNQQLLLVADYLESALVAWERRGSVSLTGGEPWIRKDAVLALVERFAKGGLVDRIDLLTNGLLLTDSDCEVLASHQLIRRVQVSIEGATPTVHDAIRGGGNFQSTLDVIRRLKSYGLTVAVMMTVSRHNASEVLDVLELMADCGVDVFSIDRFIPEGQAGNRQEWILDASEIKALYESVYHWGMSHSLPRVLMYRPLFCLIDADSPHVGAMCSVGANALTILHDGTIYPCRRLPIALGNVLTNSLHDIWYASPLLWQARTPANLKGKCQTCRHVPVCRGCRAMALAVTGDWLEEDPQCWMNGDCTLASP